MGKGSKRTKGTKVTLGDFIGSDPSGVNTINVGGKAVDMPSAPRASTLEIDITMLPSRPPYTAVVANLAYDVTEEELIKFFDGIEIEKVYIPRDEDAGDKRFKGVAYVMVDGKNAVDNLAHVLAKSDHLLLNRKVKIDIYQERGSKFGSKRGGFDSIKDDPGFGRSEADDWRSGGASTTTSSSRGGYDRDDRRGGGYDRDDRQDSGERRDYGRDDRSRGYDDRRGGGYDDRRGGGGYDDRRGGGYDRDERGGGGFPASINARSAADDDSSWRRSAPEIPERRVEDRRDEPRRDEPRRRSPDRRDEPDRRDAPRRDYSPQERRSERPRLQLTKRSVADDSEKRSAPISNNPFGNAKPIDTSKKEKEIEEKINSMSMNDRSRDDRREYRREERPSERPSEKINAEERAEQAEKELKKRVEMGIDDARPECDREDVIATSRFAALDPNLGDE